MASRKIEDLHPDLQNPAREFVIECEREGIPVLIYMTYRSNEEQNELYARGRTAPGRKVTNAKGGQSDHNFTINGKPASKAFDAVPTIDGKPVWVASSPLWDKMGAIAKKVGLRWGGDWKGFVDKPHCYI
jgi:peptidoglycan L-alanyl-D-glutamate endopeptidase CwlK